MPHTQAALEITPQLLLQAYAAGIFPMSEGRDDPNLFWVEPKRRGIIPLDGFHISRSLARKIRQNPFEIRINSDFAGVVAACADRDETWINHDIQTRYIDLFHLGHAHSIEVWDDRDLVGGVYGISIGAAFFGESMFSKRTNASKIALAHLVHRLSKTGFELFDTQFITPHLASLGAIEIPKEKYKILLADALSKTADFDNPDYCSDVFAIAHRNTPTS